MGIFEVILAFMEKGGNVLWLIAALVFFMWTLIFERVWYFTSVWKADRAAVVSAWETRGERKSWNAKKIRERLISESRELINDCLLYTSPSPRDLSTSRMPSSA